MGVINLDMVLMRKLLVHGLGLLFLADSFLAEGWATPLIALKESGNCGGCHKPGRAQKPFFARRCTLDCQGCHIDPSGGGPRNQWGHYYSQAKAGAAAINFYEPIDPLQDGSRVDLHFDGRSIRREVDGKGKFFPMSAEASVRVRPFVNYLHLTYQSQFLGRNADEMFRMVREGDRRYREKFSVMVDQIPLNTYIRAYRGTPMYGLRRPNHSLWIRERIGLDQFAVTDAVELGVAPNVPYFHVSVMKGDPYVAEELRQKGSSYHFGLRGVTLGWHVNVSGWKTSSETTDIGMQAVGLGMNIFGLILYAERNYRDVVLNTEADAETAQTQATRIYPSSVISEYTAALALIPGVMIGGVQEDYHDRERDNLRNSVFADFHIIPNLQFEIWRRFETGNRHLVDSLLVMHGYVDL